MDSLKWLSSAALILGLTGCATHTGTGAAVGTGLGALTGAVIGHQSGHAGGGALVGGLAGAVVGGLVGNAEDAREERDVAYAQAAYAEESAARAQALDNYDLVRMTNSGVSDDVIISTMSARGGQFDSSPTGVIALKNAGVSDRVILAMQQHDSGSTKYVPRRTKYVTTAPSVVYVAPPPPPPRVGVFIGHRPHWHHHHCW